MMLSFTNARGNFFNRLGKLGALLKELRDYTDIIDVSMSDDDLGVVGQYDAEPDIQAVMGGSYLNILSNAGSNLLGTLQQLANLTANRMVFRDNPQLNQTLQSDNLSASLFEIVRQMKVEGATVLAQTVTYSISQFEVMVPNHGDGVISVSTKRAVDGRTLENTFSEDLTFVCTQDSYIGNAQAGNETITITGAGNQGDVAAFNWPLGSNCNISVNAIDGNESDTSGNLLTNSGFENFTDNVPDNWVLEVGTAGTDIFEEVSIVYDPTDGGKSVRILGDGTTLTEIRQPFDSGTGTTATVDALQQVSFCAWLRRDGVALAAGVLQIALVDENGIVVQDMNGDDNAFDIDLTLLNTVFTPYTGQFRTPLIMPDELHLAVRLTTAATNGRSIYIDKASLGLMSQTYTGGPYVAVHSGSTNFVTGDLATVTFTNSRGAAGTVSTFQTLWWRLYPLVRSTELLLPSSSVPSLNDNLIS